MGVFDTVLLQQIASLNQYSEHPLAEAIVKFGKEKSTTLTASNDFEAIMGKGVVGTVAGERIALGNKKLIEQVQTSIPKEIEQQVIAEQELGKTVSYISVDEKVVGFVTITDAIKETSKEAIHLLQQQAIEVIMLTGDNRRTAKSVADQLSLSSFQAECLPEDKLNVIKKLQAAGKIVAMAGDGINDAPALAQANIGIAMGTGTDVAIESSEVTLVKGDLLGIVKAIKLGTAVMKNIKQNLFFAFVYNVLGIPIAAGLLYPVFGVLLSPMIAALAMSFSSVSVIVNSLRLKNIKLLSKQHNSGMIKKIFFTVFVLVAYGVNGQNPLSIPSTLSGTNISLTLQEGTHQFYSGFDTNTKGANGSILGPTLILNQGDVVDFSINNQLTDITTIHWHGMHVSPENDGGPHTGINPATYWYHPHLHEKTDEHVSKGIAGMIIVKDTDEAALTLPRTYGVDDFPLVIQTKNFDASKQIVVHSNADDVVMVNATIDPFLNVPAQVVRYRILNGSSQRSFNIGLTNNKQFYQISSDGGLLSAPFQTTRLFISPGERAEILINFSGMNGTDVYLKSFASELPNGIYGATNPGMGQGMTLTGYNPNSLNGTDFNILKFSVVAQGPNPVTTIPTSLVTVTPISEATSNTTRQLSFTPVTTGQNQLNGDFLINNTSFDMNVINETIPLGNTEIWELTNNSAIAHPFHIHDVQFYILSRNGSAPPINEQGRKDVVLVKPQEVVRFITKFEDFSNATVPYMYHCHLLLHEDGGMMGQFLVQNTLSLDDFFLANQMKVYPNPSNGVVYIGFDSNLKIDQLEFFDLLGRQIENVKVDINNNKIQIKELFKGVYFMRVNINNQRISKKIVIK